MAVSSEVSDDHMCAFFQSQTSLSPSKAVARIRGGSMMTEAVSIGVQWYAIHTKSRQEERADSNLRAWRVETFLPQLKQRSSRRLGVCRSTRASKPLFPRYIFARFNVNQLLHKINYTRGVQNVVGFGESATPINDGIIDLIRAQIGEDGFVRVDDDFVAGNKVKINFGPLKDLEGVFESGIKDTDRVKILLTAVSYQSHVVIEREMIEKIN
jgi:transcription elongation factor/antiterminator RfaH